jgi:hypothetical protein
VGLLTILVGALMVTVCGGGVPKAGTGVPVQAAEDLIPLRFSIRADADQLIVIRRTVS